MPKYWWKQIFAQGSFLEVGQKLKREREEKREKNSDNKANSVQFPLIFPIETELGKKRVDKNNDQLRFVHHHGCACKHAWTKKHFHQNSAVTGKNGPYFTWHDFRNERFTLFTIH